MRNGGLGRRLEAMPLRHDPGAEERAWEVVSTAFATRERAPREHRVPVRPLLVAAAAAVAVGVGVSPAGPALGGWIRETIGRERVVAVEPAQRGLASLPAPGRVLVASPGGIWVIHDKGSKRFLGAYAGASWSPRGLFVVAWRERQLVALDPEKTGGLRWSLSRRSIADARWSPTGADTRVAYRSGRSLRVVAGDGTGDSELAPRVAPVAPAWRPGTAHVLAYADAGGRVHVVDTDARRELWSTSRLASPLRLEWLAPERLLVVTERRLLVLGRPPRIWDEIELPRGVRATSASGRPATDQIAYSVLSPRTGEGSVYLYDGERSRLLFAGADAFRDLAWAPNGRYLLLGWARADQWLFVPPRPGGRVLAASDVSRQFDPGGRGPASFPRIEGWCCAS